LLRALIAKEEHLSRRRAVGASRPLVDASPGVRREAPGGPCRQAATVDRLAHAVGSGQKRSTYESASPKSGLRFGTKASRIFATTMPYCRCGSITKPLAHTTEPATARRTDSGRIRISAMGPTGEASEKGQARWECRPFCWRFVAVADRRSPAEHRRMKEAQTGPESATPGRAAGSGLKASRAESNPRAWLTAPRDEAERGLRRAWNRARRHRGGRRRSIFVLGAAA
jgi:hypothetical protein